MPAVGGSFTHQTFFGYVVCAKTSSNTFLYHFWALGASQSHYLGILSRGRIWMISYGKTLDLHCGFFKNHKFLIWHAGGVSAWDVGV